MKWSTREVREIRRLAQMPVSLEKPVGDEEDSELADLVADETAESPFDTASESLQRENVRRALETLSTRERQVLELRYGLGGQRPLTLEEVGSAFGVTRERIRQIENEHTEEVEGVARGAAAAGSVLGRSGR